jgi:hypothetical protein
MKKTKMVLIGIYAIFMIIIAVPPPAPAEVNVNIGIGIPLPPPLLIPVPPPIVPIPRTNVYFPPTIDVEILFFGGYWYRPYRDRWFRSHYYNGPWVFVEPQRVPRAIIALPPDYRHIPPGHRHIPYGQFKKSWRTWDRDRYWYRDHDWNSDYWHGKPSKYRDDGYGSGRPKPDKWDGGPPGHSGRPDKWDGGGPPGHSGKGDKGDKGDGGGPPGHQGKGKGH